MCKRKPTCKFPNFPYYIIDNPKEVKVGDFVNYRNPSSESDSWVSIKNIDSFKEKIPDSLIVIREDISTFGYYWS